MLKTDLVGRLETPILVDIKDVCGTKNNRCKIAGIYKITNPVGKIYIGQSIDVEYRFYVGYKVGKPKEQKLIFRSILKYGLENHKFEIIHVLASEGLSKNEIICKLNKLEVEYITELKSFVDDNKKGLNLSMGGDNKAHSIQSKKKISEANKGKIVKPETREKIRKARTGSKSSPESNKKNSESKLGEKNHFYGKNHTDESKRKMSKWKSENFNGEKHPFFGKTHSEESKKKMSESHKGQVIGENHKKILSERWSGEGNPMAGSARFGEKNPMFGKKQTEETKQKIRDKNTGRKHTKEALENMSKAQKGRTHSEETKKKQSESAKGRKRSPENIAKMKATKEKNKQNKNNNPNNK